MMKQRLTSLFLLILFFAFFTFLLYSFHFPSYFSISPSINLDQTKNPQFKFLIKVLTFDRIDSLSRCLSSLASADYDGDRADLHVYLDHFSALDPEKEFASIDKNLGMVHQILEFLDGFEWRHGEKLVHFRTSNAGLQAQWLEAWWPSSDDEFAFVVEDDMVLSPLYYKFFKAVILKYYYDEENFDPSIYGISLQRQKLVPGFNGNRMLIGDARIYLYQLVGTWGQLLFPRTWKEFRLWYDDHKSKQIKPFLPGMVTNNWYISKGEKNWTPWFIKFIQSRGYFNIYTNFPNEGSLSVSYRDAGVNYHQTNGPDANLLNETSFNSSYWELFPMRNLKWYDYCFKQILPGRIIRSFNEFETFLESTSQKTIVLISLFQTNDRIARNLICNLETVGMKDYIFLGEDSNLLNDLARRGYPVIHASKLFDSIRYGKPLYLNGSGPEIIKEIWLKGYIVKRSLKLGYNLWLMNTNLIPTSASMPELQDTLSDFIAAEDMELMFVKSSKSSLRTWSDDYISKVAAVAKSLLNDSSASAKKYNFVFFALKVFDEISGVKLRRFDDSMFSVKLDAKLTRTKIYSTIKMISWPQWMTPDAIEKNLQNLEMWQIDDESSCVAIVCHRS